VTGMVEGGSFGTFNQATSLSGSQPQSTGANVKYAIKVQHFRATDTPITPERIVPPGQRVISDYYDNKTYSTKLGVDFNDYVSLNQVARYTDSELRYGGGAPGNAVQSTQNVHQFFSRSEAVVSMFDGRFKNYFGLNYSDHWNWNSFAGATPTVNKGDRTKVDWRGVAQVMPGQTLVFGLEHDRETFETSTANAANGNKAGYVELQSEFARRIFLVANARHDINDRFGGHTTWRVAPAVILPGTETKLKGSVGTGFKAPTLSQMFVNFPGFPPFFPDFFGNPNLKPETSVGYDAGFEQPLFNNRVRFGATYFHNDIENLITSNAAGTTNVNIGEATTSGVEAFVAVTVTERLTLRTDYTYTDAMDEIAHQQLLRRPRNKGSVSAVWTPIDPLTLSATLVSVGRWKDVDRVTFARMDQGGYTTMNLAANYKVNENATLFGRIDNLFDARYENPNGYEQPGFGIFGGVRVSN
jgi:vitamin B12 transporter